VSGDEAHALRREPTLDRGRRSLHILVGVQSLQAFEAGLAFYRSRASANLRRAGLGEAKLRGAHLIKADLSGTNLSAADLR
jgi:hypothetical protein